MRPPEVPDPIIHPDAVISPGAEIWGQVEIGPEAFVLFGAVIRGELARVVVGAESNVQDNVVMHTDEGYPCMVGNRVTVGHSAVIHGATLADASLIGIGAIALNGSKVGEGSWLAAGSVLPEGKVIPPWTLAMGIPASPFRELTDDEIRRANEGVDHYLDLADVYRSRFRASPPEIG